MDESIESYGYAFDIGNGASEQADPVHQPTASPGGTSTASSTSMSPLLIGLLVLIVVVTCMLTCYVHRMWKKCTKDFPDNQSYVSFWTTSTANTRYTQAQAQAQPQDHVEDATSRVGSVIEVTMGDDDTEKGRFQRRLSDSSQVSSLSAQSNMQSNASAPTYNKNDDNGSYDTFLATDRIKGSNYMATNANTRVVRGVPPTSQQIRTIQNQKEQGLQIASDVFTGVILG